MHEEIERRSTKEMCVAEMVMQLREIAADRHIDVSTLPRIIH
jgi:hypothetical protein